MRCPGSPSKRNRLVVSPQRPNPRSVGENDDIRRRRAYGPKMGQREHDPRVLAIDAGGTMTDTFIVDERGGFVIGKEQTTPQDESVGLMNSAEIAMRQWD